MAKNARVKQPEPAPPLAERTPGAGDKNHLIALWQEGDTLTYMRHDEPRALEIHIDGKPYTHAGADADGVWIYRNDRKN